MDMTLAFVVAPSDVLALKARLQDSLKDNSLICSSSAEFSLLAQAGLVYFVVSQVSMCSTSYQQLVSDALALVDESRRKLLRLDDVEIPVGFSALQFLPVSGL